MRLAGKIKRGYYPAPERVVRMVASHLILPKEPNKIALLDPCCGEGKAIMQLRDLFGPNRTLTYGVEVAPERAAICRELPFTQFIKSDAVVGIDWPKHAYDLVWFNPPYDWDDENRREELRFFNALIKQYRIMKPGAIFVGVLPRTHMHYMANALLMMLDGLSQDDETVGVPEVFCFPDPEYDEFGQVIVLGVVRRRIRRIVPDETLKAWIDSIESDECPILDFAEAPRWPLTFYTGKERPQNMDSVLFDPLRGASLARQHGWMAREDTKEVLFSRRPPVVQVARPLNTSHMAAAITAGFFNGQEIDGSQESFRREMVKGRTTKALNTIMNREKQADGSYVTQAQEVFTSEVFSVDPEGIFRVYHLAKRPNAETVKGNEVNTYPDVEEGDLKEWIERMGDALKRTSARLFPPLISDQALDKYDLSQFITPKPQLKQNELIKCVMHQIDQKQPAIVVVKQGGGKTLISLYAARPYIEAAWAKGKKFRIAIICDKHMLMKWKREAERAIPGVKVLVAESISDVDPNQPRVRAPKPVKKGRMTERTHKKLVRKWANPHPLDADIFVMAYTDISLSANVIPAAVVKPLVQKDRYGDYEVVWNSAKTDPVTGKKTPYFVLTCPKCGEIQKVTQRDNTFTYLTAEALKEKRYYCERILTRLVLDEKTGTRERVIESVDAAGNLVKITRKYRVEILKDKHGKAKRCGCPLWTQTANRLDLKAIAPKEARAVVEDINALASHHKDYVLEDYKTKVNIKHSGPRKIDIARFLQKQFKLPSADPRRGGAPISFDVCFIDEVHKTKSKESARGMAAANIGSLAKRSVVALTGTLSGGYSSTMFYLLWRYTKLIRTLFTYDEGHRFVSRYGQQSYTWKTKKEYMAVDAATVGAMSRRKEGQPTIKEIPGLSPEAYLLFWYCTIFSELVEIFPNLPDYRDVVIEKALDNEAITVWKIPALNPDGTKQLDPDTGEEIVIEKPFTQATAYEYIRERLETEAKLMLARGDKGLLAAMLQTLLRWPNLPTEPIEIYHPRTKHLIVSFPGLRSDVIYPKERAILERVVADKKAGHRSIIFVTHTGKADVMARLEEVFRQSQTITGEKLNVAVLRSTDVEAADREEWIQERVQGTETQPPIDVLLCNPRLVDTGLDLIAFSRTHWVEVDYSVYTMAQASRRTMRPGQDKAVETLYWVYNRALETGALKLMAQKSKELAKISGSDLNEALMQQAGAFNLQELLTLQLTRNLSTDGFIVDADDIQNEFNDRATIDAQNKQAILDQSLPSIVIPAAVIPIRLDVAIEQPVEQPTEQSKEEESAQEESEKPPEQRFTDGPKMQLVQSTTTNDDADLDDFFAAMDALELPEEDLTQADILTPDGSIAIPGVILEEKPGEIQIVTNLAGISEPMPSATPQVSTEFKKTPPTWDELRTLLAEQKTKRKRKSDRSFN